MNPLLTKSYEAAAAIAACRIVKWGVADLKVIQATDASAGIGISEQLAVALGGTVDVIRAGLAFLELGGTVVRGQSIVADANGKGVAAAITPGAELHVVATAEISGVAGDIIPVHVIPTVIATDAGVLSVDVTITAAQLLALNATPKQLVAAPGAGKAIVPVSIQAFYDYNTAAYAGIAAGEDIAIRYTDGAGVILAEIETTGFLDQVADQYRFVYPLADAAKTPAANAALVAHMKTGEIITGDGPLKLRVRYRVIDLAI